MITIALDAGHGGTDPGGSGFGTKEKDVVLQVAKDTKAHLEKHYEGVKVLLTRASDVTKSLPTRTNAANKAQADSLVSIHTNAFNKKARGYEDFVYISDGEGSKSVALQKAIHKRLSKLWLDAGSPNRGSQKKNLHMVREFKGAAVLIELGFIDEAADNKLINDNAFMQKNVVALAEALADYHNLKPKAAKKAPVKTPVKAPAKAPAKPAVKASAKKYAVVTADILNVRSGDGVSYKVIDVVKKGEKFTVRKVQPNGWVQFISGGYVNGKYVKITD